ncbi:MAG: triose-phosphate isomerase [Pseudomonadota bacterium]
MKQAHTWLIANWKMNGDRARVHAYAAEMGRALADAALDVTVVFCPPSPYLASARDAIGEASPLKLGGQDCHAKTHGACTGEVSAPMLADMGCSYVIVGHSERRAEGETCADVCAKAEAAMAAGLIPIICIGESRAEYEAGRTRAALSEQLVPIAALSATDYLIAYEPIWAIGTSQTPSSIEIADAHTHIKSALGSETCVLYGGSVNAANGEEILGIAHVSGALIGGASLEISSMRAILACATKRGM